MDAFSHILASLTSVQDGGDIHLFYSGNSQAVLTTGDRPAKTGDNDLLSFTTGWGLGRRLAQELPKHYVHELSTSVELVQLRDAIRATAAGRHACYNTWLDMLFVDTCRQALANSADTPGWFTGVSDSVCGPALAAIHAAPGEEWSIDRIAELTGYSRSSVTEHFSRILGDSPMTYVTALRLDLAASELATSKVTLSDLADRLGYSSPFSFSAAFKRHTGQSPAHFRKAARDQA